MSTAAIRKLQANVHLHKAAGAGGSSPLVLFFPWLRAPQRAVGKYVQLYTGLGMDVLVASGQLRHFAAPASGRRFARRLGDCLPAAGWCPDTQPKRRLLLHGVSIGAYLLTVFQMQLAEAGRLRQLEESVAGQVMDSIVYGGLQRMVSGVRSEMPALARPLATAYFRLAPASVPNYYDECVQFFLNDLAKSPVLFLYSDNDPLCDARQLRERALPTMRSAGHTVTSVSWPQSQHAAHLRRHPVEYQAALRRFLRDCLPDEASLADAS